MGSYLCSDSKGSRFDRNSQLLSFAKHLNSKTLKLLLALDVYLLKGYLVNDLNDVRDFNLVPFSSMKKKRNLSGGNFPVFTGSIHS